MAVDLSTMNENQRDAVMWNDGPLLVLAGPGSGKTRVLTTRVARLLEEDEDASVLALTFTTRAAAEMRERVDDLLGHRGERTHLCTFHAYATEMLRQHGSHLGLQPDFALLTHDEDRLQVLDPVAEELEAEAHELPADRHNLLSLIDHLFRESYDGEDEASGLADTPAWLPALFARYCEALTVSNRQDFGSLISFACRLLRQNPAIAGVLRIGWSHVCVDEFQDTNKAQYDLLRLLAPPTRANLFVVGDDDQILYQWNGASPERLQALRSDYEMRVIQLPENYRCPPEIVERANYLISHNQMRTDGKRPLMALRPPSENSHPVVYREFQTETEEAQAVAEHIFSRGSEAAECAVLARNTKLLDRVARSITAVGLVPYRAKRKDDYDVPVVCVLVHALRLANARHDREILRRLCVAWQALSGGCLEVDDVAATATLMGGDFLRAWAMLASNGIAPPATALVRKLNASLVDRLDFPDIVDWFLDDGWTHWKEEGSVELEDEIGIWEEFHRQFLAEHGVEGATLNAYLQTMDLASKVSPAPPGAVQCLTVHGSKGLEFRHVYLIGMAQEVLPSFQALKNGDKSRELEEERRNCFVAITRAMESIMLTRARSYNGWPKQPSQFLEEMGLSAPCDSPDGQD